MSDCVAILLSTYNGERFLPELLASFNGQSHPNWLLYWRDDGSTDGTLAIMESFAPNAVCVPGPNGRRLLATGSFLGLLKAALSGPAAFFAFADQDDVWLPEKLAHGAAALAALPKDRPALFFCARTLVDAELRQVGHVPVPKRLPTFPAALTQNIAPGCCMMLNRAAAALIDAGPVPEGSWHDWWAYLVVSANDGAVVAGQTPDILYRQHDDNLVGEPRGFWLRALAAARRGRKPFMTLFWNQVAALMAGPVPNGSRATLEAIARSRDGGPVARARILCLPNFGRQKATENFLFCLWFLLG